MKYAIEFQSNPRFSEFGPALERSATIALEHQSAEAGGLSIVLTDGNSIRDLNRTFAGDDHPTDVLSFIDGTPDPEGGLVYYGDVIIAVDIAQSQAENAGHSLIAELCLLTVHGVLHLLGHDHADHEKKKEMWASQGQIIKALGIELNEAHNTQ